MMRQYALLGWFFLGASAAGAQVVSPAADSISQRLDRRLRQGPVPPMVRVIQVREQLAAALRTDRAAALLPLLDYLARVVPDSLTALQPAEAWALRAAAGDFAGLLQRVRADNPFDARPTHGRPQLPPRDGLFDLAQGHLLRHADELRARARQAAATAEDSAFLDVLMPLLMLRREAMPPGLNADLRAFLQHYPRSEYGYLVSRFVAPEYVPSRFSYGLDFHSGSAWFGGGLGAAFRPVANFGHGFEFGWDRYRLYLRNYIGFAETRVAYTNDGHTWAAGQRLNYYVPEISVGYCVYDGPRLRLTPFAGVSWCNFAPPSKAAQLNPAIATDVTMRHPFTAGLNADVLLWKTESPGETGSWMLKLRTGVRAAEAQLNPATAGALLYFDVGIGGFGRMLRPKASPQGGK